MEREAAQQYMEEQCEAERVQDAAEKTIIKLIYLKYNGNTAGCRESRYLPRNADPDFFTREYRWEGDKEWNQDMRKEYQLFANLVRNATGSEYSLCFRPRIPGAYLYKLGMFYEHEVSTASLLP